MSHSTTNTVFSLPRAKWCLTETLFPISALNFYIIVCLTSSISSLETNPLCLSQTLISFFSYLEGYEWKEGKYDLEDFKTDLSHIKYKVRLKIMNFRFTILLLQFIQQCKGFYESRPRNKCIVTSFMISNVVVIWSICWEGFICVGSFYLWEDLIGFGVLMNLLKTGSYWYRFIQFGYSRKHKLRII